MSERPEYGDSEPESDRDYGLDPEEDVREGSEREIDELLSGRGGAVPAGSGDEPGPAINSGRSGIAGRERSGSTAGSGSGSGHEPPEAATAREEDPLQRGRVRLPFNYGALIGLLFVVIVAIAVFNLLTSQESGTVGIGDVGIGERVAPFAVPIATSNLEGDANIDPDEACEVPGEDVLRICDYFDRPTVVSFWFTTGASACIDQQDVFETVAGRFGDRVNMLSINVRDERERVRELIEERDWKVTVGHDADGAVSNIYRVGGCPTFLFVAPGGVLERAEIGPTTFNELSAQVRSFADGE